MNIHERPTEATKAVHSPLEGLRVIDFSTGLAGPFCTMMLADLGADVVKVENTSSGAAKSSNDTMSVALGRNKKAAVLDLGNAEGRAGALALIASADAVVDSFATGEAEQFGLTAEAMLAVNPSLIHCSLSTFGKTGPLGGSSASDLVLQALTGGMDITGEPGRPPVKMGLPLDEEISGLVAAIAILAKAEQRERTGQGSELDISAFDADLAMLSYMTSIYFATGQSTKKLGSSHPTIFPYNAFKTKDGYVVAAPFTQTFWRKFCTVIGREDLPANPKYKSFAERLQNRPELSAIIDGLFLEKTTAEWLKLLEAGDVPNGPVNSVADALALNQTVARGMIVEIDDPKRGRIKTLGSPFRFDFQSEATFRPTFRPLKQTQSTAAPAAANPKPAATAKAATSQLPLAGIRVLDLTRMFAGPYAGQFMADLGADVIKVEEPKIGDPTRRNIPMVKGESTYFMAVNRGKRSITMDLKLPEAREAFLGLVAKSDVVIENFRPGVMERLGLSYEDLRQAKSDIILLSLSGFGQTGPLRDKISFDLVNQAMSGTMGITGEANRPPVRIGLPVGDLSGGIFGALAVLAALRSRRRTGRGAAIDLSLHDLLVSLVGPIAQICLSTGVSPGPMGSSDRDIVPSRAYEASDGWIVLAALNEAQWQALTGVLGRSELASDRRFATNADRLANREALDKEIENAVKGRMAADLLAALKSAGVPSAPVLSMGEALDSPQALSRGMVLSFEHPIAGACRGVGTAIFADGQTLTAPLPPPVLGQHTEEILKGLLGLSDERIAALRATKAIG